jgi:hypothetical protein
MVRAFCIFCLASTIFTGPFVRYSRCLAAEKETDHAALICQRLEKNGCLKIENTLYYCQKVEGRTLKDVYMLYRDGNFVTKWHACQIEIINVVDKLDKDWAPDGCVRLKMKLVHSWGESNWGESKTVFIEEHDEPIRPAQAKSHDLSMAELFLFMRIEKELSERKKDN